MLLFWSQPVSVQLLSIWISDTFQQKRVFFEIELYLVVTRKLNKLKFSVKNVIDKQRIAVLPTFLICDLF